MSEQDDSRWIAIKVWIESREGEPGIESRAALKEAVFSLYRVAGGAHGASPKAIAAGSLSTVARILGVEP